MLQVSALTFPLAVAVRQITRRWALPQRPREKLARLLFKPEWQRGRPFRIRHRGAVFVGDFSTYLDWRVFFLGDFERETLNLCCFLAKHVGGRAFADVGANKGLYTVSLAGHFARVIAFEPSPAPRHQLQALVELNDLQNVTLMPVALGERSGEATFYAPRNAAEGHGSLLPLNDGETFTVPVRTGDECLAATRVGLVKIDVEGLEAMVLAGLRQTLSRDRPFVIFEVGDSAKQPFAERGGVAASFPPDYRFFEVSDHSTVRDFALRPLKSEEILARRITNNLACPAERVSLLADWIRG